MLEKIQIFMYFSVNIVIDDIRVIRLLLIASLRSSAPMAGLSILLPGEASCSFIRAMMAGIYWLHDSLFPTLGN